MYMYSRVHNVHVQPSVYMYMYSGVYTCTAECILHVRTDACKYVKRFSQCDDPSSDVKLGACYMYMYMFMTISAMREHDNNLQQQNYII